MPPESAITLLSNPTLVETPGTVLPPGKRFMAWCAGIQKGRGGEGIGESLRRNKGSHRLKVSPQPGERRRPVYLVVRADERAGVERKPAHSPGPRLSRACTSAIWRTRTRRYSDTSDAVMTRPR